MLAVIRHIKEHGFEETIKKFNLKYNDYGHKVIVKYDQIKSNMEHEEVRDARGLVLEKGTWNVMSLAFRKFFNSAEGHAAKIDWKTAHVLEKLDGTLIHVYWDWHTNKWCAGTTGMAEAEGLVNNKYDTSFANLFWGTVGDKYSLTSEGVGKRGVTLNKDFIYAFELTTPYNIVVKPHGESSATLLGIRDRRDLSELQYGDMVELANLFDLPVVKRYDLNEPNVGKLLNTFREMTWHEEGYVVVDANFNRIKIKNPAYVAVHHLKDSTAEHNIMGVVKSNEIDEFAATFPERKEEIFDLKDKYDELLGKLTTVWDEIPKPKNITAKERKKFAMNVHETIKKHNLDMFKGMFFGLQDGKLESVDKFLFDFDNKKLYQYL